MMDVPESLVQQAPAAANGNAPAGPDPGSDNLKMASAELAPYHAANGENYLQQQRSRFADEMAANPAVRSTLRAVIQHENAGAGPAVAESLMNRMSMTGGSLMSPVGGMSGGVASFYGPIRKGQIAPLAAAIDRNPVLKARLDTYIDQALAGSNVVRGHTDQGSAGDPNYYAGGTGVNIAGERFNHWGGFRGQGYSAAWTADQQAKVAAGAPYSGPVGISDISPDARNRGRMEDRAAQANYINKLYRQGGGGPAYEFMRAGAVPKVGELAESPSTNIEDRTGEEGPIMLPSDLTAVLQRLGMRLRAMQDDKMAQDLGMDDIQALLDKYVPKSRRR